MKKYDYIVIVMVIAIAIGSLGVLTIKPRGGYTSKYVVISSENKVVKRISLNDKTKETFTVKNGLGENTIEISNGNVFIHDADCPDKICIKDGAIREPGQILVCLPNKVVVEIKGEANQEIDDVAH